MVDATKANEDALIGVNMRARDVVGRLLARLDSEVSVLRKANSISAAAEQLDELAARAEHYLNED